MTTLDPSLSSPGSSSGYGSAEEDHLLQIKAFSFFDLSVHDTVTPSPDHGPLSPLSDNGDRYLSISSNLTSSLAFAEEFISDEALGSIFDEFLEFETEVTQLHDPEELEFSSNGQVIYLDNLSDSSLCAGETEENFCGRSYSLSMVSNAANSLTPESCRQEISEVDRLESLLSSQNSSGSVMSRDAVSSQVGTDECKKSPDGTESRLQSGEVFATLSTQRCRGSRECHSGQSKFRDHEGRHSQTESVLLGQSSAGNSIKPTERTGHGSHNTSSIDGLLKSSYSSGSLLIRSTRENLSGKSTRRTPEVKQNIRYLPTTDIANDKNAKPETGNKFYESENQRNISFTIRGHDIETTSVQKSRSRRSYSELDDHRYTTLMPDDDTPPPVKSTKTGSVFNGNGSRKTEKTTLEAFLLTTEVLHANKGSDAMLAKVTNPDGLARMVHPSETYRRPQFRPETTATKSVLERILTDKGRDREVQKQSLAGRKFNSSARSEDKPEVGVTPNGYLSNSVETEDVYVPYQNENPDQESLQLELLCEDPGGHVWTSSEMFSNEMDTIITENLNPTNIWMHQVISDLL